MDENFKLLFDRVLDALNQTDLIALKQQLDEIKGNTIVIGAGGSKVVAEYAVKALKTGGINVAKSTRDLNHENIDNFDNILICSYSGKGHVVDNSIKENKNIYLFTSNKLSTPNTIHYKNSIKKEHSFISLASTLIPMTLLYYYHNPLRIPHFESILKNMFDKAKEIDLDNSRVFEILTGSEYKAATTFLETTFTESGIAIPIIHDKYDYCHGRSTMSYHHNHSLIYFDSKTELDKLLLDNLSKYYKQIILVNKYYNSIFDTSIDDDYFATIQSMYIAKRIAELNNKDLSNVNYSPLVKKLYYYKGEM